jgi:hypothetical protein
MPHTHSDDEFTDFYADLPTDYSRLKPIQHGSPAEVFSCFSGVGLDQPEGFASYHEENAVREAVEIDRLLLDRLKSYLRHELGEGRMVGTEGQDVENCLISIDAERLIEVLVDNFLSDHFESGCEEELDALSKSQ